MAKGTDGARRPLLAGGRADRGGPGRRRVGLLVGLAVTVLVTAVGVLSYGMLIRGQERQIKRELAYTASRGDPSGPPGCTWLFLLHDGEISGGAVPARPGSRSRRR